MLERFSRIALDSSIFIYHLEGDPRFGETTRRMFRVVEEGHVSAIASSIVLTEILVKPLRSRRPDLVGRYRQYLTGFPNLEIRSVDVRVAELAAAIRAGHGFETPDAIHLATALDAGAEAFVTNDRRLKGFRELPVLLLNFFQQK